MAKLIRTKPQNVTYGNGVKNPQKATAYVGKGVLRNGDTLTSIKGHFSPVPNGHLIKKDGTALKKGGKVKVSAGGEKHVVYKKTSPTGVGKGKKGDIMVNHPTTDKGKWDTIDLTKINKAKTIKEGVSSVKKWHKEHPMMKNGGSTPAWQRKAGKNPEGGLNAKGVASYRVSHPGSKLKTAVTTKPSKLKAGSKAAGRRKSFCSRMSGMKKKLTSAKTANDPNSRINKSLRKWHC
jgi:hypothetical protein